MSIAWTIQKNSLLLVQSLAFSDSETGLGVSHVEKEAVIRQNSGRLGNQQFTRFPHLGSLL
jgi:hypothetical protein